MTDKLWEPPDGGVAYGSVAETYRVQQLLLEEVERRLTEASAVNAHDARGQIAQEWVRLAEKEGQKVPGIPLRSPLEDADPMDTLEHRKRDAAGASIRHLWAGARSSEWVLVGIEATICAARGMALPGKWYETQATLDLNDHLNPPPARDDAERPLGRLAPRR